MTYVVPVNPVPAQSFTVFIDNTEWTMTLRQRSTGLYADILANGVPVAYGALCSDRNLIIRATYLGLPGDFAFVDQNSYSDPQYTGFGSQYKLIYYPSGASPSLPPILSMSGVNYTNIQLVNAVKDANGNYFPWFTVPPCPYNPSQFGALWTKGGLLYQSGVGSTGDSAILPPIVGKSALGDVYPVLGQMIQSGDPGIPGAWWVSGGVIYQTPGVPEYTSGSVLTTVDGSGGTYVKCNVPLPNYDPGMASAMWSSGNKIMVSAG